MIINKDGGITHVVNAASNSDDLIVDHTSDGIFIGLDYTISYTISGYNRKVAALTMKGSELIDGIGTVMRLTNLNYGTFDLTKARETASAFTNIWASMVIDQSTSMRAKLIDQYGNALVNQIIKMMRGNRKNKAILKNFIGGYMFIHKMSDDESKKFDPDYRVLCVQDVSAPDGFCSDWENQPVTKRLGIKSIEEFREICRNGVILPEWKAAA